MKMKVEIAKVWQILGNIEGCQEMLNRAIKCKDWQKVEEISKYLDKVKERINSLDED